MSNLSPLTINIYIAVYFLANGVVVGQIIDYYNGDVKFYKNWRMLLGVAITALIGSIAVWVFFICALIYEWYRDHVLSEIKFYWRLHRTQYFEEAIKRDKRFLYNANRASSVSKGWSGRRFRRHVKILSNKLQYDYEKEKIEKELERKKIEDAWE